MRCHLDHVFVLSPPGAPGAAPLLAAGMQFGRRRQHQGQGTANACVFFASMMLEFLWLDDERAAGSGPAASLLLPERSRWRDTGASPFGLCLRTDRDDPAALPFASAPYRPPYLPVGMTIRVAAGLPPAAPLLFSVAAPWQPPPGEHAWSAAALTRCRVATPAAAALAATLRGPLPEELAMCAADEHLMELSLRSPGGDGAPQRIDLRPDLPLAVRW